MTDMMVVLSVASEIFHSLVFSSALEPASSTLDEKHDIIVKFWENEAHWLRQNFGADGIGPDGSYGFGYLVEGFARYSGKLPKNSERAEKTAHALREAMHLGKNRYVNLGKRMSNSDFIWIRNTGRLATIYGIGEVKSSYEAAVAKAGGQLKLQENYLELFLDHIESAKTSGTAHGFFRKRKIEISDQLMKVLIVPFGEGSKCLQDFRLAGWKVMELEFSYNELVFIAKQIWPSFRVDIRFDEGVIGRFEKLTFSLSEWFGQILKRKEVFADEAEPVSFWEIALFVLATEKIPLTGKQINFSVRYVRTLYGVSLQDCLRGNTGPGSLESLSVNEKLFYEKYRYFFTDSADDLLFLFRFGRCLGRRIGFLALNEQKSDFLESFHNKPLIELA